MRISCRPGAVVKVIPDSVAEFWAERIDMSDDTASINGQHRYVTHRNLECGDILPLDRKIAEKL